MVMAPAPVASSRTPATATQQRIYDAQGNVISARQAEIDARNRQLAAQRKALDESGKAAAVSSAYLDLQSQNNAAGRQEFQGIQAASLNMADKTAIAQAQTQRNDQDYRFGAGGLKPDAEIDTPNGADGVLPPGVRARLQTQEQLLTTKATANAKSRGFGLEDGRIAAAKANQAVEAANRSATSAGFDATQASLGVAGANLQEDISKRAPAGNLVYDDEAGNWVTPQEYRVAQAQRGIEYDEVNKTFVPRQELLSRTDDKGNVLRTSDGVWVDPKTKNEFNGETWVSPYGHILQADGTWLDPATGNVFHVENPETGSGYWVNRQGYILKADGIWEHPVTGQRMINDTVFSPQQLAEYRSTKAKSGGYGSDDSGADSWGSTP